MTNEEKSVWEAIIASTKWKIDTVVDNHFGERVWLKANLNAEGEQTGITDCCLVEEPCEYHAQRTRS